jgi:hypothetical protein
MKFSPPTKIRKLWFYLAVVFHRGRSNLVDHDAHKLSADALGLIKASEAGIRPSRRVNQILANMAVFHLDF